MLKVRQCVFTSCMEMTSQSGIVAGVERGAGVTIGTGSCAKFVGNGR
jgi:hypothetical protein